MDSTNEGTAMSSQMADSSEGKTFVELASAPTKKQKSLEESFNRFEVTAENVGQVLTALENVPWHVLIESLARKWSGFSTEIRNQFLRSLWENKQADTQVPAHGTLAGHLVFHHFDDAHLLLERAVKLSRSDAMRKRFRTVLADTWLKPMEAGHRAIERLNWKHLSTDWRSGFLEDLVEAVHAAETGKPDSAKKAPVRADLRLAARDWLQSLRSEAGSDAQLIDSFVAKLDRRPFVPQPPAASAPPARQNSDHESARTVPTNAKDTSPLRPEHPSDSSRPQHQRLEERDNDFGAGLISRLRSLLGDLERADRDLRMRLKEAQSQLRDSDEKRKTVETKLRSHEAQISQLRRDVDAERRSAREFEGKLAEAVERHDAAVAREHRLKTTVERQQEELARLASEIARLNSVLELTKHDGRQSVQREQEEERKRMGQSIRDSVARDLRDFREGVSSDLPAAEKVGYLADVFNRMTKHLKSGGVPLEE